MKTTALLVYFTYLSTTTAMVLPSLRQMVRIPLQAAEKGTEVVTGSFKSAVAAVVTIEEPPAAMWARTVGRKDNLNTQALLSDGQDPNTDVPINGSQNDKNNGDEEATSCFCSGTSICCYEGGEVDCSHGFCGV